MKFSGSGAAQNMMSDLSHHTLSAQQLDRVIREGHEDDGTTKSSSAAWCREDERKSFELFPEVLMFDVTISPGCCGPLHPLRPMSQGFMRATYSRIMKNTTTTCVRLYH
jgi:hypothetical protein